MKKSRNDLFCRDVYYSAEHDSEERFSCYWHQIDEIVSRKPKRILEIGIGNGFVSDYLKKRGFDVVTADHNKKLKPDFVSDILSLPFEDNSFDLVACYECLEHLPFDDFAAALRECRRVSKRWVNISIPGSFWAYRIHLDIPRLGSKKILIPKPYFKKEKKPANPRHFWEIGLPGTEMDAVTNAILATGLKIEKCFRIFENPYHHMFVLKKK